MESHKIHVPNHQPVIHDTDKNPLRLVSVLRSLATGLRELAVETATSWPIVLSFECFFLRDRMGLSENKKPPRMLMC